MKEGTGMFAIDASYEERKMTTPKRKSRSQTHFMTGGQREESMWIEIGYE